MVRDRLTPPSPPLGSERLVLRLIAESDRTALVTASRDPLIRRYTFPQKDPSEADREEWITQRMRPWEPATAPFVMADRKSDQLLGRITLHVVTPRDTAEAGFWVLPDQRNRGVASSAVELISDRAFDGLGIERLVLLASIENLASHRVAERCGFTHEGVLRGYQRIDDERLDVVSWSLLASDQRLWQRTDTT